MTVKSTHPKYDAMLQNWKLCTDSYAGSPTIKAELSTYLPPTDGQIADGFGTANSVGQMSYDAYILRAVYPDFYKEGIKVNIGAMHKNEATILLPDEMEYLREDCTPLGESLQTLLRRINVEQLNTGRIGLLADITEGINSKAYISTYSANSIRNWDDVTDSEVSSDASLVVLDESGDVLDDDFKWKRIERYRVLALGYADETLGFVKTKGGEDEQGIKSTYLTARIEGDKDIRGAKYDEPNHFGTTLEQVPFVFINASDLSPNPEIPPLIGLAETCLVIYRGEADHRRNLSMQGEDTLVTIGEGQGENRIDGTINENDVLRTGAGARIKVPLGGDAKYIGVSSDGLSEQRTEKENDHKLAQQRSGLLTEGSGSGKESGEALTIRVSAQTATLPQVAKTGASGLEKILKIIAEWTGANPEKVSVTANLEFVTQTFDGKSLVELTNAKVSGAPISWESIHGYMVDQGVTKLTFKEEESAIALEAPMGLEEPTTPSLLDTKPKPKTDE